MTNFKVGDRVVVTNNHYWEGVTGTVKSFDGKFTRIICDADAKHSDGTPVLAHYRDPDGNGASLYSHRLSLIEKPDEELAKEYRRLRQEATDIAQKLQDRGYNPQFIRDRMCSWGNLVFNPGTKFRFTKTETITEMQPVTKTVTKEI